MPKVKKVTTIPGQNIIILVPRFIGNCRIDLLFLRLYKKFCNRITKNLSGIHVILNFWHNITKVRYTLESLEKSHEMTYLRCECNLAALLTKSS